MKFGRWIAGICAGAIILSAVPFGYASEHTVFAEEEIPTSGTCGKNVWWRFNENDGSLEISGSGEMYNYTLNSPWASFRESIQSIIIKEGVTAIGYRAFADCINLENVKIPQSVNVIEGHAFYNTMWLTTMMAENTFAIINGFLIDGHNCEGDIIIPDSVITISNCSFDCCENLTSVTIPSSVTTIGDKAFSSCYNLSSVTIPNSVTTIGDKAFTDCYNLSTISMSENVSYIGNKAFSETPWLEARRQETPLVIVNGILIDGKGCESYATIPDEVKSIGAGAFSGNKQLWSITISDNVTSIEKYAFCDCPGLKYINIPNNSVREIEEGVFTNCDNLYNVTIPMGVISIGKYAFDNCRNLQSVIFSRSVKYIGANFSNCARLESITILNPDCKFGDYDPDTFYILPNSTSSKLYGVEIHGYANATDLLHGLEGGWISLYGGTFSPLVYGDIDDSYDVTILDVIKVNKYLLGSSELNIIELSNADVDGNGSIDSTDSLNILKFVVELIDSFDNL